ncbi:MAG: hypothetical protein AAB932_02615 [Patescibacteria group bacterium]
MLLVRLLAVAGFAAAALTLGASVGYVSNELNTGNNGIARAVVAPNSDMAPDTWAIATAEPSAHEWSLVRCVVPMTSETVMTVAQDAVPASMADSDEPLDDAQVANNIGENNAHTIAAAIADAELEAGTPRKA